jgi:dihydrofolate reductase
VKTILYMSLTADGHIPQADLGDRLPPEILADSMGHVARAGNLVVGRTTYELLRGLAPPEGLPGQVVVVSRTLEQEEAGPLVARSPAEALKLLAGGGLDSAFVLGGGQVYSAFIAGGLVDELYLNITPEIFGSGLHISTAERTSLDLELLGSSEILKDTIQLRYRCRRPAI